MLANVMYKMMMMLSMNPASNAPNPLYSLPTSLDLVRQAEEH
jgi:hypothetical protein